MANIGTVTIVLYTQLGPYQRGSRLLTTPAYAQRLLNAYGRNLDIRSTYPGTYWFQDGAVLSVYPPRPTPGPFPPGPLPPRPVPVPVPPRQQFITIDFESTIGPYQEGNRYRLTLAQAQNLAGSYPGVTFTNLRGQRVDEDDLEDYVGRGRLTAELIFF